MKITKEQFEVYNQVKESGTTNMFAVNTVSVLSGLKKDEVFEIMKTYKELNKKYSEVRK